MKQLAHWSLGKILVLILVGAFATIVLDLRYEHNHVLAKHEIAWTLILYSGLMTLAGAVGLARWERGGRQMLTAVFAAGFVVGALGFWYHGQGHVFGDLGQMLSVWTGGHPNPVKKPPLLAPLAFAGLGLVGILACSRRLSPEAADPEGAPMTERELQTQAEQTQAEEGRDMKGSVLVGKHDVQVRDVLDAEIVDSTDVLMRTTSTCICGTDLHFYDGRMPYYGHLIGHEPMGVVEEVGSAVRSLRKGDRIVVPTHICCGFCQNCWKGLSGACLTTHPGAAGAAYGYPNQGGYAGAQAELVRVPFADANALKLPGEPGDDREHDFAMLADIFPTGYHATELAQVGRGDTVAVFGAGGVGLLAAHSASLRGAAWV